MVLRKITIDNSVRYIPKSEQTKKNIKQNTIKSNSTPKKKQTKIISQNNKKFPKHFSAQGFKYITK